MNKNNETFTQFHTLDKGFKLDSGETLPKVTIAYETYGRLNQDKSNAILIFHAFSGSAHVAGINIGRKQKFWNDENITGWWDTFVGPDKIIDTEKFFVICANCLGGCYGTTGPVSYNPKTRRYYGGSFS